MDNYKQSNKKKRYDNIDLIEFIGMLFVILYHGTTVDCNIVDNPSVIVYCNYIIRPILSTCVPLFFFANGFLLMNKSFDLKKHIKKMIKLIVLTGLWGIITLVFLMFIKNEFFGLKDFIVSLLTWKLGWINHLWYMGALICIYVLFPLIKIVFDYNRKIFNYFVIVCLILTFGNTLLSMIATILNYFVLGGREYIAYNFFNIFNPFRGIYGYAFVYFCIGGLVCSKQTILCEKIKKCKYANKLSLTIIIFLSTILLGLYGIFISRLTKSGWDVVWNGYDTIFTLVNVLAIYGLSIYYQYEDNKVCKYIQMISKNTLGIYFIHKIFLSFFVELGITSFPFMNNFLFNILYAFIIMFLCLQTTLLLKKLPGLKKLVI